MERSAEQAEPPEPPPRDSSDVIPDTFDVGGPDNRTAGDGISHVSLGAAGAAEEEPSSAAQLSEEQVRPASRARAGVLQTGVTGCEELACSLLHALVPSLECD